MATLVIGGSGFIGSAVVQSLLLRGLEPLSYDLILSDQSGLKQNWVRADILELQSIERVFFDFNIDSIIHLVGLPSIDYCQRSPHFSFLLNVMSVQNTLEAMRRADIPKIVFASSATVYGSHSEKPLSEQSNTNPVNVYGWHKLIAEETITSYIDAYGIKGTVLRLFNVYGGDPRFGKEVVSIFINRALKGEPIVVKGPEKYRDFVHVEDVAEAFSRCVSTSGASGKTLNVGTGRKTSLKQLALIVSSVFPKAKIIVEQTSDDGTGMYANTKVAEEVLGLKPRDPEMGIRDHVMKYSRLGASSK